MSIYATEWSLKFPKDGDGHLGCEWVEVWAQAVPAHIGTPTPGFGYEHGDPYASFLPPAIETDADGRAPFHRAVVFVTEHTVKGTARAGQEYVDPLFVLTGEQYARISFTALYERICAALRGDRSRVVAEVSGKDGRHVIVRADGTSEVVRKADGK